MSKQAYAEPAFDDSTPFVELRIPGLQHSHDDVFTLEGMTAKPITPAQVERMEAALGRSLHPWLVDDIASVLFKWDIVDALSERIKLA